MLLSGGWEVKGPVHLSWAGWQGPIFTQPTGLLVSFGDFLSVFGGGGCTVPRSVQYIHTARRLTGRDPYGRVGTASKVQDEQTIGGGKPPASHRKGE